MGRPQQIDRNALHRILWRRTDQFRRITFKGQEYAQALLISPYHFSRIMAEGELHGRWRTVKTGKHSIKTYEIADPEAWGQIA